MATKLQVPRLPDGVVARPRLLARLGAMGDLPLVAVLAPAGFGKSTLLAQVAAATARPIAWYTADHRDHDPATLILGLAAALERVGTLSPNVSAAVTLPGPSIWTSAMPRLADAVRGAGPILIVIDEVDQITGREAVEVIVSLTGHLSAGAQILVAGRTAGDLPLARLIVARTAGMIEQDDLAFLPDEAVGLLASAGASLPPHEVDELVERTEGWAAAMYLAAVARARTGRSVSELLADRWVGDYVRSEVLATFDADDRAFLARTAILDTVSGPLCDAALERTGSGAVLDRLARSNRLVVALDPERQWYQLQPVLADVLRAEHRDQATDKQAVLHRALRWHEAHGMPEVALEYAFRAEDREAVERILSRTLQPILNSGRRGTIGRWLDGLERLGPADPSVAVVASAIVAIDGDAPRSARWLGHADRIGPAPGVDPRVDGMRALGHALAMTDGASRMADEATIAAALIPADDIWHPAAVMLVGVAAAILDDEAADDAIDHSIDAYERQGAGHIAGATAYAMRASRALDRGDVHGATAAVARARRILREHGLAEIVLAGLLDALAARLAIRQGGAAQARADLIHAQRFRPHLTRAILWLAIMTRLELATAMLGLDDPGGARFLLQEIRELVDPGIDIGRFATRIDALDAALRHRDGSVSPSTLSAAELRLLPLLTTHLTFREIAAHLFLSSNTIKTQAISIYRKLDATSRTQAVERATSLGLIDGGPTTPAGRLV